MEAWLVFVVFGVGVESEAWRGDGRGELGQGVVGLVDEGLVEVDPQGLGGLQLGGVGWPVDEADAFGPDQAGGGVPAGALEPEEEEAVAPGACLSWAKSARVCSKSALSTPVERGPVALSGSPAKPRLSPTAL